MVMLAYRPRLRLSVEHAFHVQGRARAMRFEPDPDTADWLRQNDCLSRATGDGLELHAPSAPDARVYQQLVWSVRCDDPQFNAITADLPEGPDRVVVLRARQAARDAVPVQLHKATTVSMSDAWPAHPPGTLAATLSPRDRLLPPLLVVMVPAPDLQSDADFVAHYRAAFAARAPIWKYCLLGDWSQDPLQIVDLAQSVQFSAPVAQRLEAGQQAWAIRSLSGVELRARSEHRFQLRSRAAQADRVLVKRLPVADADHFARETIEGVPTLVSEIYVHR